jgi:selenophosphate synthase
MLEVGIHATDITGYGLLGHAYEMAERSPRDCASTECLPPSMARDVCATGQASGGLGRNRAYLRDCMVAAAAGPA